MESALGTHQDRPRSPHKVLAFRTACAFHRSRSALVPALLLESLRPPRLRPALWHALAHLSAPGDPCVVHHHAAVWNNFLRLHREWSPELARTPELAAIGHDLLDRARPLHERVEGCIWLTRFPSLETVEALRRIALDPNEPSELRSQATWTLGYRQLDDSDDSLLWTPEAESTADATLAQLWQTQGRESLTELLPALRHVARPEVLNLLAQDVVAAAPGLEAFATTELAQLLVDRLPYIPSPDAPRIIRLIGQVLGRDVVPKLLTLATWAPLTERVELLMTALALDPQRARDPVNVYLSSLTFDRVARERAAWHERNPGYLPTVRALATARRTAVLPREERQLRCREAACDFAGLAAIEPYPEEYLGRLWARVAWRSREDDALLACVELSPKVLEHSPFLVEPYLEALAHGGKFQRLGRVARAQGATAQGTWLLATHGRPYSALSLRQLATCQGRAVPAVAGGALALFLLGRPDLATLALDRDRPEAQSLQGLGRPDFPGPDELWRVEHEPYRCPALTALVRGGLPQLLGFLRGAPEGADPRGARSLTARGPREGPKAATSRARRYASWVPSPM